MQPACSCLLLAHILWAMQASLADTQLEQKQSAYAAEVMRQGASHEPATASTMGLRNATGEYNCFLNVIIQCMWHCHAFRQSVMDWNPAAYQVGQQLHTSAASLTVVLSEAINFRTIHN